VALPEALPE
jgi:hypothetical protein